MCLSIQKETHSHTNFIKNSLAKNLEYCNYLNITIGKTQKGRTVSKMTEIEGILHQLQRLYNSWKEQIFFLIEFRILFQEINFVFSLLRTVAYRNTYST